MSTLDERIAQAEEGKTAETKPAAKSKANPKAKVLKEGDGYAKNAAENVPDAGTEATAPAEKPAKAKKEKAPKEEKPAKEKTNKIAEIIALAKAGKTKAEIIEAGYNKSTVGVQLGKLKKAAQAEAPAAE